MSYSLTRDSETWHWARAAVAVLLFASLTACGGGCNDCNAGTTRESSTLADGIEDFSQAQRISGAQLNAPTRQEATRFLTQATFGPTPEEVSRLMAIGIPAWLDEQFAKPMAAMSHLAAWDSADVDIIKATPGQRASSGQVVSTFWRQAITGPDQLRQRVAFALSEIFVVSIRESCGDNAYSRGVAGYLDMLGQHAFGNYRSLLESVTLHPVMGCYLSHMKNQAEDTETGRVPDENFAREIMQLFSIGLHQLNPDGTLKLDTNKQPIETYSAADISGLAKVFTGWSWWCARGLSSICFFSDPGYAEQFVTNMRGYGLYHSKSEKRFLNAVVPASTFSTPEGSLKVALDTLAAHPNVGPFIGKQLIQRLVTSNPSPAYVGRVSHAFNTSGGSLKAMVKAILIDPEARDMGALKSSTFGKVREPILKLSALMRAVGVKSESGMFLITNSSDPGTSLAQTPMASPSVFNFFRPGYVMPGSNSARVNLVTPELQIASETSVAGYINFMTGYMWGGVGHSGYGGTTGRLDILMDANTDPSHPLLLLTDQPTALVEEFNQRLMYGSMPAELKADVVNAVSSLDFRLGAAPTQEQILRTRKYRLWTAMLLITVSPEFQIQK